MSQNSMNQKNWNEWKIDNRSQADIEDRIRKLASSYVPEWHFDRENPDIGSVIARVFAGQMDGNILRYNQVLEKYHTEFVNMLGISLLPAKPAAATVLMNLVRDTIPGIQVYKGTKLLAETDRDGDQIIFETMHNLYVTNSVLEAVFMTEEKEGKIIPLKGFFPSPRLIDNVREPEEGVQEEGQGQEENRQEEAFPAEDREYELKPFRLFASKRKGIEKHALLLYHSVVLDVEDNNIYVKIHNGEKLIRKIEDNAYRFHYCTEEGLIPVEQVQVLADRETVVLRKEKKNVKTELDGMEYSLLALVAGEPVEENLQVSRIAMSSSGDRVLVEFAGNGDTEFDPREFDPFGDTLSLFQECFLGHDEYFGKAGAVVKLTFEAAYPEHRMLNVVQGEDPELKIIKRKPKAIWVDAAADARAEEISFEYFNGVGWKKLNTFQETRRMFADDNKGIYEITFVCPDDWQETGAGAYQGRCIRMQILKADNCYMRPCIHHYPHIKNLEVSFSYESHYMDPERLIAVTGTKKIDLTRMVKEGKGFTAFSKGMYAADGLYLGFSRKMESGPVSILFQMEDGVRFEGTKCKFEYSTLKGFKQMKVLDYTVDMSRSGTVMFMPQADMHAVTLEGKKEYWIRISPVDPGRKKKDEALPVIKEISPNAVQAMNIETREEEDFYLEEPAPNMTVNLGVSNILDMDLWVNEMGKYSRQQMLRMMKESPDTVRGEYDILGEISSFYVKWQEADQLDDPPSRRSYLLDRMNNRLIFGDGIHGDIPSVLDDVAFKATIRCCNGKEGNVEPGAVNDSLENLMFVDSIFNPVKAYGGSSIEDLDSALVRGANILRSRRRLVSVEDYIQEIRSFSDTIDKVRCVAGRTIHGENKDSAVTFVILLKDFQAGSYSFHRVSGMLKKHLLSSCELTIAPEDLHIVEPIFAEVSVDIWAEVLEMDDSFEVQNLLQETLERYLNPISSPHGNGWEIGSMPKKPQLMMRLNVLKSKAVIKKMVVTVKYTDQHGTHEMDLDDMKESPFVICRSGRHRVNIMISEERSAYVK